MSQMLPGPDGWSFTAEGAALHPAERTAVIADVHLGYEWARGRGGDCVPAHSLSETLEGLTALLGRASLARLVVAGDLVESRRPCPRARRDLAALRRWLNERGVELVAVAGNHDPPTRPALPTSLEVAGWTISHGHRPLTAPRTISGHHHPSLRAAGVNAPCFVVGPGRIVLPAFSRNAAGTGLETLGAVLGPEEEGARCLATAGGVVLDFGPAHALVRALHG